MNSLRLQADGAESSVDVAIRLARAGKWADALKHADASEFGGNRNDGELALLLEIARLKLGLAKVSSINAELVRKGDPDDVRRLLISPYVQANTLEPATQLLGTLIEAEPPALRDRRQRSSLYARLGRWDDAIGDIDAVAAADPSDASVKGIQIQYRILGGREGEARNLVRSMDHLPRDNRTLNFMIVALLREKDFSEAADIAVRIDRDEVEDPLLAGNMIQALFRARRFDDAIAVGEGLLNQVDGPSLRSHLGQAWFYGGKMRQRFIKAIEHLEIGVEQAPDNLRMISLLGQSQLRVGKIDEAIPHLRKSVEMQPEMAQIRALYARALKEAGRFDEAAEQFTTMMSQSPDRGGRWQRYAAGALSQAGRHDEAADIFDAWVAQREAKLPASFRSGLDALWNQVDEVKIPKRRLDWAWDLRSPDCKLSRDDWETRAKWGYLADHYLLDWLECRDAQVEEAMRQFAEELELVEQFIEEAHARAPGKGCVFASAHVGAMYFGPLALELLGVRSRWLASTPSVARTSYAQSLISTSDQTQAQVARMFQDSLRQDETVVVVVDGAINLAAPRIEFEGEEITYSEFAARVAYRTGSSSAFVAPMWRDDYHLAFDLHHLPMPEEGESAEDYALRWRAEYLGHLRNFLGGRPENLRLSGGIWRHIR